MTDTNRLYRRAIDRITGYAIYMLSVDGTVQSCNAGAIDDMGYSAEELIGRYFGLFYTPGEQRRGEPQRNLQIAREQGRFECESWRLCRDGSLFRASVVIDALHEEGKLIGFAQIIRDITHHYRRQQRIVEDRDLARQQLVESTALLDFMQVVVDNIPTRVIVEDRQSGEIVLNNYHQDSAAAGSDRPRLACRSARELLEPIRREHLDIDRTDTAASRDMRLAIKCDSRYMHLRYRTLTMMAGRSTTGYRLYLIDDITEEHEAQQTISHMAQHDAMTGLPNRKFFSERTASALALTDSRQQCVGMLLLDLDGFKSVNDVFGHQTGDELLRQMATRLSGELRSSEMLARIGGDEFALLIPSMETEETLHPLAERLIRTAAAPFHIGEHHIQSGISLGGALSSTDTNSFEQLLRRADLALYEAKRHGKGRFQPFHAELEHVARDRLQMEMELRHALANDELALLYQPLFDISGERMTGYEALMRWHHPTRGTVAPGEFIPAAESAGLARDIGAWAITQACHQASHWPAWLSVAVNLSPLQFGHHELIEDVRHALETTGLAPQRLELEVTERILLEGGRHNIELLQQLRALGVRLVLDDFGTGTSSLHYLRTFAFDRLKIDHSFINEVSESRETLAIVRAIAAMGHSLGMDIIAEGVERADQLPLLQKAGCSHLQGYLFGRPRPPQAALSLADAQDDPRHAAHGPEGASPPHSTP